MSIEVQFNRYKNVIKFATEWRKYKLVNKHLDENAFRVAMQTNEYVRIECMDEKKKRKILIYLMSQNNKYVKSSQNLKSLLNKINEQCDVIFITYQKFSTYGIKAMSKHKRIMIRKIYTYLHEIFDLEIPKGPLAAKHRIISSDEVLKVCNEDMFCTITGMPKIFDEDPQAIWIGAENGDVLEITTLSDIMGEYVHYRVVVPKSGRVIMNKEPVEVEKKETEETEEVDDELAEHREMNAVEDDADDADDVDNADDTKENTDIEDIGDNPPDSDDE